MGPVIDIAAAIGGDLAYAFLRRFVESLPPGSAPYELSRNWEHFEADQHAEDILPPPSDFRDRNRLPLDVHTRDQWNALRLLNPITGIAFREAFTEDEIVEHLSPEHTHTARIHSGQLLKDLKFIPKFPALKKLTLSECIQLTGTEDLAGIPLADLNLMNLPDEFSIVATDSLSRLTRLALCTRLPWESLAELPAPKGLTSLTLGGWIDTSLADASRWQQLQDLVINTAPEKEE
ncbi:hypothetical protein ACIQZB_42670 [Streptomyces sp. NPDC097727]|uniref:hypothetical protein n=1 Tax=Streptomyces sp. NPDC097727 TaxID=3366092 RepID=UPI0038055615